MDPTCFWTAFGAIAQALAAGFALAALFYAIYTHAKSMRAMHYGELDKMYFELVKERMSKPFLQRPAMLANQDQREQYDAYAYLLWNFLETIHDRCRDDQDPVLCNTWYVVIDTENAVHRAWLLEPVHQAMFKPEFIDFVKKRPFVARIPAPQTGETAT